jgi:glycosyltransferase involved in cell wall biosynthesis
LIEAFAELHRRGQSDVRLRVAGYVTAKDQTFLEQQRAVVREAGLESHVEFAGELDRDEKLRFLHGLDLLAVPTVYQEAKGLFALESLAAGVPVVLPNHGGFPELIEETGGGRLFKPGSPTALADVIGGLLADPAELARHGAAGHDAIFRTRSADAMAAATLAVYDELLNDFDTVRSSA